MRIILIIIPLFLFFPDADAQRSRQKELPESPRLIVQVVIDHMSIDYLYRYQDIFSEGGFKKLMNEGFYIRNGYHPYPVDQYASGYVGITTGTIPAIHGMIGDTWYNRLQEIVVNATEDKDYDAVGGGFGSGSFAPTQMLFPSFSDRLRLLSQFRNKVYSVSLFNNAAILTSGFSANGAFWYDNKKGNWVSSSYYYDTLPGFVTDFNNKGIQDIYMEKEWQTFYSIGDYKASMPDDSRYESGLNNQYTFPYQLSKLQKKYGYDLLNMTPFGNTFTKEFAISLIYDEQLGRGEHTDFLSIVFSANRAIEDKFGPKSVEMQDTWIRLDNEIEHLIQFLEQQFEKENVLIVVTSGSGTAQKIDYLRDHKIPAGHVNTRAALALLRSYLNILYGQNDWVPFYHQKQFYLNHKAIEDNGIDFSDIQHKAADFLVQITGIADVIKSESIKNSSFQGTYYEMYQNGFYPERSGDLTLVFEPNWCERVGTKDMYDYEQRVPVFLYGWKAPKITLDREVSVTDLVPTIYRMLNIPVPNGTFGNIIPELFSSEKY